MTSTRLRTAVTLAAAVGVLIALTSCAPAVGQHHGGAHPGASATPTPTPTPTVSTLDTTAPTPLADIDCSKFVTAAQITAAFGSVPVTMSETPAIATGDLQAQDAQIPAMDYVRATGGISCLWSNTPVNYYYSATPFPVYKAIEVSVLFNAQTAWSVEQAVNGDYGNLNDGSCDLGECELDQYVGGSTWINATEINQNSAHDPFGSIIAQAKAAVIAAGVVGADPAPATGTLPIGTTCTDFVADADATTALGGAPVVSVQPLKQEDDLDYYGIWTGSQDELRDHPCEWKRGAVVVGHLSWLAGGAWAWDEAEALPYIGAPAQSLAVPGLANGDTAFIRCAPSEANCVADLILGGNWIEAEVAQPGTTNRADVTALAAAIVSKVG